VRISACCEQLNGAAAGGVELVLVEVDAPSREQDERDLDVHLVAFSKPVLELREEGALRRIVHSRASIRRSSPMPGGEHALK